MAPKKAPAGLLLGASLVLGAPTSSFAANAEAFDKPLQTKVVDLGRSSLLMRKDEHVKLTCFYYSHFMVKQLDDPGNKGALFIAIVITRPGQVPACTRRHGPGEELFPQDWDQYFGGVKRDLVFLFAADGTDEGLGFRAFDSRTRAKVFEDSVSLLHQEIDFAQASDNQITLRYLRVVSGDCSVPKDGSACWSKFREKLGLKLAPMPKCRDYEGEEAGKAPSVVYYPVQVSLFPKPLMKALDDPITCWPSD
jgi:hypothetical protein